MDDLRQYSRKENELESIVFWRNMRMWLAIENSAILVMKKDKIVKAVGIELPGSG